MSAAMDDLQARAFALAMQGFGPIPITTKSKGGEPGGFQGAKSEFPSMDRWQEVVQADPERWGNLGVRLPAGVVGVDVDSYKEGAGAAALYAEWDFPPTVRVTARRLTHPDAGVHLFGVPSGLSTAECWSALTGRGIEVIRVEHRYCMAIGSWNPDAGAVYEWVDDRTGRVLDAPPPVSDLPVLSQGQFALLTKKGGVWAAHQQARRETRSAAGRQHQTPGEAAGGTPAATQPSGEWCEFVQAPVAQLRQTLAAGTGRYDESVTQVKRLFHLDGEGHRGVAAALEVLKAEYIAAVEDDRPAGEAQTEWDRQVAGAGELTEQEPWCSCDQNAKNREWVAGIQPTTNVDEEVQTAESIRQRFPASNLRFLISGERPTREWTVSGLLTTGGSHSLVARAGEGKSLLALSIAMDVAAGRPALGLETKQARVLYVDMENTQVDLAERLSLFGVEESDINAMDGRFFHLDLPPLGGLDSAEGAGLLLEVMSEYGIGAGDLVVFDSIQRVVSGEENDSKTYQRLYEHTALPLKRAQVTSLRLDNMGKDPDRGSRGTSGKRDDVDVEWLLTRKGEEVWLKPGKGRMTSGLETVNTRWAWRAPGLGGYQPIQRQETALMLAAVWLNSQEDIPLTASHREVAAACEGRPGKPSRDLLREAHNRRKEG